MTATDGTTPGWEEIARTWGTHFTFAFEPEAHPEEPHAATRKDGMGTLRSTTHAGLLDKIKDDLADRPFTRQTTPAPEGETC